NGTLIDRWVFNSYKIYHKNEYWRLLTSGFIHADYSHLIFNMISLYFFGAFVEEYYRYVFGELYGAGFYLTLYLVGILLSDVYSLFAYKNSLNFNSLGASGAVSAIVYASILLSPLDKIYIFFIPIGIPGFIYGIIYLIYTSYLAKQSNDHVNHFAHFGGAIIGVLFTIVIYPPSVDLFIDQIKTWI
ncbi:MAG: rhomboid family intramembrane serine protease, partial [Cytophagales bacterium]